ncbi:hypothetical protein [Tichowtungia aerotolerans]|uniref:Uncharacterized protein n=1 Tax=Tichowtungia aerotolerans TaxID=2697043 RepID=A0A6P1M6L3_9BACT|nr:hypothetical protein [Tichowtungia aerotolerans]QHI70220.1 hypothetical protein GT409_12475 [Tichowtungia aerotolerans]
MARFYKPGIFHGMSKGQAVGFLVLMGFVLFVALRIFTPPTEVVQRISSPDGSREARLMLVYYYSDPGYKIATRSGLLWHTRLYMPEYKDGSAAKREALLRWSDDSKQLFFEINGKLIWSDRF